MNVPILGTNPTSLTTTTISPSSATYPVAEEGIFTCTVIEGCGLTVRGVAPHADLQDCLETSILYVELYFRAQQVINSLNTYATKTHQQFQALLEANQKLVEEKDRLAAELRNARRGTPAAKQSVLEGAEDLAARMKLKSSGEG